MKLSIEKVRPKYYKVYKDGEVVATVKFRKQNRTLAKIKTGQKVTVAHSWDERGKYVIEAKAKDSFDAESNWSTLEATMPKTKTFHFNQNLLNLLLERFFHRFPLLRRIFMI